MKASVFLKSKINFIVKREGITYSELSKKLGISHSLMSLILSNQRGAGSDFLSGLMYHYPEICIQYLNMKYKEKGK